MKIEDVKVAKNKMKFTLKNANYAMANAIRRTLMSEVPAMAIDEIDFYENRSSMFDEYLGHRMGLIPLTTDLKSYTPADECCGGNCGKCSVILTLDAQGPSTVYSKDLKSKDKDVKPFYDNIPIIKLGEGQAIRLEAKAVLGRGKQHAKFQPCTCSYNSQKTDETKFDFEIESYGNHEPEVLLKAALKIIEAKIDELEDQIKK
ncbi:DNA-directed RNA polymerase subunit D [Candidatus Micrarchaeota archaeon]|nr:DNA-directed RNA polymerase subunit D [Candidatus Micrarchaeota archaeon]